MQKSYSFILPMMGFKVTMAIHNTYLGNIEYEGSDNWGDYFYAECKIDYLNKVIYSMMREHSQYVTELDTEDSTIFVFKLTDEQKRSIVQPFINGKYSKIDRKYVSLNFPKVSKGSISSNWRILIKDEWERPSNINSLKKYWADKGVNIPEGAEVWSAPKKKDEVYGYVEEKVNKPLTWIDYLEPGLIYTKEKIEELMLKYG